jgi:NAD(P)-dependent dehydrogenase (short-subunit alcohol dehydrogenase family)
MVTSFTGTVVLTGANGGLGSAIVQHIVSSPDLSASLHGVYTVRDLETSSGLKSALNHGISTHNHESIALDLGRLSDVRKATDAINQRVESGAIPPIRALILNAGYQEQTIQTYSDDGFDASFQCNYLSHWLFTLRLLKSMDKQHGRIIVIGSCTHEYLP